MFTQLRFTLLREGIINHHFQDGALAFWGTVGLFLVPVAQPRDELAQVIGLSVYFALLIFHVEYVPPLIRGMGPRRGSHFQKKHSVR